MGRLMKLKVPIPCKNPTEKSSPEIFQFVLCVIPKNLYNIKVYFFHSLTAFIHSCFLMMIIITIIILLPQCLLLRIAIIMKNPLESEIS